MRMMMLLVTCLLLGSTSSVEGQDDTIVVIVNKGAKGAPLTKADLRLMFQTTKTEWAGRKVIPLNLPRGDSARVAFDEAVLGLNVELAQRYWVDRKIRGGNPPPKQLSDQSQVVKVVAAKEEAIGYVRKSAVTPSVAVVATIQAGKVIGI